MQFDGCVENGNIKTCQNRINLNFFSQWTKQYIFFLLNLPSKQWIDGNNISSGDRRKQDVIWCVGKEKQIEKQKIYSEFSVSRYEKGVKF